MTKTIASTRSQRLFEKAQLVMPGGVNSPVRSCKPVGGEPVFIEKADGSYMYDVDGNRYIDYCGSWGPMILGHRHPRVLEAIEDTLQFGTSFGAPCKQEVELAELICHMVPSIEMVRMVNSGTEACMGAIRLARAFTKRSLVLKFDGCYHGHADSFLVKAGSGLATLGISSSPGVPEEIAKLTISVPFNDIDALTKAFEEHPDKIAAVMVEPIVGNSGLLLPEDKFLETMRELCTKHGALLIFDEVMTGFRVASGGAQQKYEIKPDLTCLGKIIGGGLPVGAYGGRKDIMEMVAPQGPVYQAGTLSGNPLAMAAGLAQLRTLQFPASYQMLEDKTNKLAEGLKGLASKGNVPFQVVHVTGMICVFLSKDKVTNLAQAQKCDTAAFSKLWKTLLDKGIYWPPSQFESAFVSLVHSRKDIEETIAAFEEG
ncbi:MAG TPA: glutamate-1-semialdehyde 2,1-aminomutase, partial [Trichormus sp.]